MSLNEISKVATDSRRNGSPNVKDKTMKFLYFLPPLFASIVADQCSDLGRDLECSACKLFIDKFFADVAKAPSALVRSGSSTNNLWHDGPKKSKPLSIEKVYSQRLIDIYKAQGLPEKAKGVSNLLKKSKGTEHELYIRGIVDKQIE